MERPKTTKNVGQPCVICGQSADAQAAIAALQAQLTQLDRTLADVYAQREGLQKDLAQRTAELEAAKAELEQERVRLASCLIAAEGGTKDIVKQGDYGWSPAYQATLNLQAELERVRGLVKTYAAAKIDFDDKRLQEDHHAWRERYTRLVGAETILIALTATSQEGQHGQ